MPVQLQVHLASDQVQYIQVVVVYMAIAMYTTTTCMYDTSMPLPLVR